jgi:hypothetical protein
MAAEYSSHATMTKFSWHSAAGFVMGNDATATPSEMVISVT